eukprot:CAMPEP_0174697676 /NCGR_PEP_ID=MMETSP1094-20130205/3468_1 /TAXON_ID=156173 /ORGANISM="Chrysochromulina brevifilum, Strain UTEX LB 985" /LENGTH=378 /DNA_ID=CAMNT_0015894699 /DNA_START=386 /DNA_END=1522 /DNA_ORIENTATION=-
MWGRRKPFIFFGSLTAALASWLLGVPTHFIHGEAVPTKIYDAQPAWMASVDVFNCSALKQFAINFINHTEGASSKNDKRVPRPTVAMLFFFGAAYACRYTFGWTIAAIPYDALGQELSPHPEERRRVFMAKAFAFTLGTFFTLTAGVLLAFSFGDDMNRQSGNISVMASILLCVTGMLACLVQERAEQMLTPSSSRSLIGSLVDALTLNTPYLKWLWMKLFLTFAVHLPVFNMLFWFKYVLRRENAILSMNCFFVIMAVASFFSGHIAGKLQDRVGSVNTIRLVSISSGLYLLYLGYVSTVQPSLVGRSMVLLGLLGGTVSMSTLTNLRVADGILAEVLDYDQLLSGLSRSAVYVVISNSTMQAADVVGGVLPVCNRH